MSRRPSLDLRRCLTASCSTVLHLGALVAIVVVPLLLYSVLPGRPGAVTVFLTEPMLVPAPPPPPPARASPARVERPAPRTGIEPSDVFVAPIVVPAEVRPEDGFDLGVDDAVIGGVEGGVPGGVVGGIVGGLPDAGAGTPPPVRPVRVSGLLKEPMKTRHVPPVYPPVAVAGKLQGTVVVEALIDERGRVTGVEVLEGDELFIDAAVEAVRQWAYTPTLLDGVPVPVIMTVTVRFELSD